MKHFTIQNHERLAAPAVFFVCLLFASYLFAQTGNSKPHKQVYAVLVGVSRYNNARDNLHFADADAQDMYNKLIAMGVPADHMEILTNENATHSAVIGAMHRQFSKATAPDEVIFFFSGHGGPGFLVATDMPYYLYYNSLKAEFKACDAHEKILFADACFSGGLKEDSKNIRDSTTEKAIKDFADSTKQIVVFSASRSSQTSKENALLHGFFTYFLIKSFEGQADANGDGFVTYRELFDYVNENVRHVSNNQQVPTMFGKFNPDANFFRVYKN